MDSDRITIRTAGIPDIQAIQHVARESWPVAYGNIISKEQIEYMLDWMYSTASLTEQMTDARTEFVVAETLQGVVGFASYTTDVGGYSKLNKLYVLSTTKGRGYGAKLLVECMHRAQRKGASYMELQVNKANPSKQFYERMGFVIRQSYVMEIGQGYVMDDYIMQRSLD